VKSRVCSGNFTRNKKTGAKGIEKRAKAKAKAKAKAIK